MFDLHTIRLPHLWNSHDLDSFQRFVRQTAFVICHKDEPIRMLWRILWYLPADANIIISTNCHPDFFSGLATELKRHVPHHRNLYLLHQKDPSLAAAISNHPESSIQDATGLIHNGKGEGMYLGTWFARLLNARFVAYYDADNHSPAILMPFTMALSRLFLPRKKQLVSPQNHNVRIAWYSKPGTGDHMATNVVGRCTRMIAPILDQLAREWYGDQPRRIITPNAGEQAFTMETISQMRFSSAFSIETFLLLELMNVARLNPTTTRLDQYLSQSPFFHTKKDDSHVNRMIADSLSAFQPFQEMLPASVRGIINYLEQERELDIPAVRTYPCIAELPQSLATDEWNINRQASRDS